MIMTLNDIDLYYVKCIGALYSNEHIIKKEPSLLQTNLEEAIKQKTGISKDFGPLIACHYTRPVEEIRTIHGIEDIKTASSSDNELELDLFNEDLMCVVCNGMDVAAGNQLLECSDCHSLYHQECHRPPVSTVDAEGTFTCQNCRDAAKSLKKSASSSSLSQSTSSVTNIKAAKNSPPHLKPPSSSTQSYKSNVIKSSSSSSSKSSKSSLKSSSSSSSGSKSVITPTINIISADKRLQIMKKKAAKLHEKKKHSSR